MSICCAPDKIIASKLPLAEMGAATNVQRPLCPYPRVAHLAEQTTLAWTGQSFMVTHGWFME